MKRISARFGFLVLALSLLGQAQAPGKTSVAVYPIKAVGAVDKSLAQTMTSLLGYELSQSPKLIYIREDMLKEVMKRQAQNISDACDSTLCQVEIGKLVQAQKMVVGDLSKLGSLYILTVNLIDVETGAVENTFKERCACKEDELEQLASAAGNKIREHFGETGLTVQAFPLPETPSPGQPAPISRQGYGSLAIATEPSGAEVYLDAELKGKTPITLTKVPAGTHSLSIMKPGYSPIMKEVVINANSTFPVSELLLKLTSALEITTTSSGTTDYKQVYELALDQFRQKNYEAARAKFEGFLDAYPDTELSDNAQFAIGECYYALSQFEKAVLEYDKVRKNYPSGNKVPNALWKMALAFDRLGNRDVAKGFLKELVEKFPRSPEADLAKKNLASWQ